MPEVSFFLTALGLTGAALMLFWTLIYILDGTQKYHMWAMLTGIIWGLLNTLLLFVVMYCLVDMFL